MLRCSGVNPLLVQLSEMDEFHQLAIARACSILIADIVCPGANEPSTLEAAREVLARNNFPVSTILGVEELPRSAAAEGLRKA